MYKYILADLYCLPVSHINASRQCSRHSGSPWLRSEESLHYIPEVELRFSNVVWPSLPLCLALYLQYLKTSLTEWLEAVDDLGHKSNQHSRIAKA